MKLPPDMRTGEWVALRDGTHALKLDCGIALQLRGGGKIPWICEVSGLAKGEWTLGSFNVRGAKKVALRGVQLWLEMVMDQLTAALIDVGTEPG